jgi:hypothetical protein
LALPNAGKGEKENLQKRIHPYTTPFRSDSPARLKVFQFSWRDNQKVYSV